MKRWITALGTLAMMSGGCAPTVLDPVHGEGGSSSAGTTTASGPGSSTALDALAMRAGDLPSGSGPWPQTPDPDALVLFFASEAQSCSDPFINMPLNMVPSSSCDPYWQTALLIPPELDRAGLIDLRDPRIGWAASEVFASCAGQGGGVTPGTQGTLEILGSDATSVSVTLSGGVKSMMTVIDGSYSAKRCDTAPPVTPPAPAIAILGANLPAADGGATPDPTALYVFLGSAPETCQDPLSDIDCTNTSRLVFSLPASLQQPGTISLSDPAIAATGTVSGSPQSPPCAATTASFTQGTLEISSIDATAISFTVYQSFIPGASVTGGFDADGLYAASICQ